MVNDEYDLFCNKYLGTDYGDLRRERAQLMKRMVFENDASVKPRIRELTNLITEYLRAKK